MEEVVFYRATRGVLINVLGLDFGVAGTDGQVMNGHANEKIGDRDRGYNSPGRWEGGIDGIFK